MTPKPKKNSSLLDRPPSTPGRDGSPQPSQTSGATRRHEGRLRLKNGASQRSAPTFVFPPLPIRVHPSPFAGQRFPLRASASLREMSAFSLVELLVVMAIIGMMVGLSALAVSGMRAPAVQHAADQVMSGLSLARQIAITKNTRAAFLVATNTNVGSGLPAEPFRYWSVVYSNKGANNWSFAKDWEALPNGAIFWEILPNSAGGPTNGYNSVTINPFPTNRPAFAFANYTIVAGNSTIINNGSFADAEFKSSGEAVPKIGTNSSGTANIHGTSIAIRVCEGAVLSGNATLTSTNRYYFIESNLRTGRIRMRAPESYTP